MNHQSVLGLIVAYYLSKYDPVSYSNLGYKNRSAAHQDIARRLNINPNSLKNKRDEFDSVNDNTRVGWYQRDLSFSRKKVVEIFQEMPEPEFREVVLEILQGQPLDSESEFQDVLNAIAHTDKKKTHGARPFIIRGPTGRKAEEYFVSYHSIHGLPLPGNLVDTRELGCGYDFCIQTSDGDYAVEVKGLDAASGGLAFTAKEWQMALDYSDRYFLVIVSNLGDAPNVKIIQNPALKISPMKSIITTVQVRWNVSETSLAKAYTSEE